MAGESTQALLREGAAALQRGDGRAACAAFERLVAAGDGSARTLLLWAQACRLSGDAEGEERALDRLLKAEPRNLHGLLRRADAYARRRDTRAAVSFYQAALAEAARAAPPPAAEPELRRARDYVRAAGGDYTAWLVDTLAAKGLAPASVGGRFEEAFDILLGRKRIYLQQPSTFYYPGLPLRQFYEGSEFAWAEALEAKTAAIREELLALVAGGADFSPYLEAEKDRPHRDFHGMMGDRSWGAFYLWKDGAAVAENIALCPRAAEAMGEVPLSGIGRRTPSVLFSRLRPGAHIPPHNGMLNCRLICHLPLVVPPGCWLRVGNAVRQTQEGRLLIFDDSIEHEARNESREDRIVLLFDVWRPELGEEERAAISAMFEAIDAFGRPAAG